MPRRKTLIAGFIVALAAASFAGRGIFFPERELDVISIRTDAAYQDPQRLDRAFALPVASRYQPLTYQPNASLCGPTSIANLLHSLGEPAPSPEGVLEGSHKCPFGVCWNGLTLDEVADLARARTQGRGNRVRVLRDFDLVQFREHLRASNDPAKRYLINFDRGPLFGKAGGHHSPIGGYLVQDDRVLVLDVNATFKPWLVSSERLFSAMDTVDSSSGKKRGLLLVEEGSR